jgi:hypothetical protein
MMVQNGCACEQNKQMLFPNIVLWGALKCVYYIVESVH